MHQKPRFSGIDRRVKALRAALGLSQLELAEAADITQQALSKLESGKCPQVTAETVILLARALGVSADWLVTGEGNARKGSQ